MSENSEGTRPVPAALAAVGAASLAILAAFLGSRGFKDFDAALIGYFVGTVFAVSALAYRYTLWLTRPPTWRYFRATWRYIMSKQHFRQHKSFLPVTIWRDLIGQTFILKRGFKRWFAHQAIFWGVVLSLMITMPLTFGWMRFTLVPPGTYQLWTAGFPVMQFPIESLTGFSLFHGLDWTALLLLVGVGLALWRRLHDVGQLTTQRFGFDLMPLVLLLAIAITGLLLTASSMLWEGQYYWFISLTHQLVVVGWLISIPFGKFFHIVQRPASVGIKLYQTVNQEAQACRQCGDPLPSAQFVADLKATLGDLDQNYDLGDDRGWLQEYCPTCKRKLRGQAYYQIMEGRFL